MNLRQIIGLIARLAVGGVLIYSGLSKAIAPSQEFAAAMAVYHILPMGIIPSLAVVWPWLELLVGTYVLFGYFTRIFAGVAIAMFLIFLSVLSSAMLRHINPTSCGCFGIGMTLSIHQGILLDSCLLVLAVILTLGTTDPLPLSADRWIER